MESGLVDVQTLMPTFLGFFSGLDLLLFIYFRPRRENETPDRRRKRHELIFAITAFFHGFCSFFLSFIVLAMEGINLFQPNTFFQKLLMSFSMAYFVCDTITGIAFGINDFPMVLHHLFVLLGYSACLHKDRYGSFVMGFLFLTESSNSFFQLRTIFGYRSDTENLSFFCGILFIVTFLAARTFLLAELLFPVFGSTASLAVKVLSGLIWLLSLHWSWVMVNLLFKELKDSSSSFVRWGHDKLNTLRRKRTFLTLLYLCFAGLAFGKTILVWNHEELL